MIYCIYHDNCLDGWCAAYLVQRCFGTAIAIPAKHNEPFDCSQFKSGDRVIMVDFCFDKETMEKLDNLVDLTVIDHHISSESVVKSCKKHVFDVEYSGALLTYNWLQTQPEWVDILRILHKIVVHVSIGDTWKFRDQRDRDIYTAISLYERTFLQWAWIESSMPGIFDALPIIGSGANMMKRNLIRHAVKYAEPIYIAGVEGRCFIQPYPQLVSEVGEALATICGTYGAIVSELEDGRIKVSLRSVPHLDVSNTCKHYGGGGHKNAGNFVLESMDKFKELLQWQENGQ